MGELEEDVEGMQGMIFMLRQQLKEAQEQISRLQAENEQLRTLSIPPDPEPGGSSVANSSSTTPLHAWGDAEHNAGAASCTSLQLSVNVPGKTASQKRTTLDSPTNAQTGAVPESHSSGLEATNQDHLLAAAQTFEDFKPGVFASKVTPDSGVHTQEEEEDVSVDASDFAPLTSRLDSHQPSQTCDRLNPADQTVSSTDNISSDSAYLTCGQQTTAHFIAEKVTSPATLPEDPSLTQSSNSKSESQAENEYPRTTLALAQDAMSSSTDLSNHHTLSSSTQIASAETRTSDKVESPPAVDTLVTTNASTQGSNDTCLSATVQNNENASLRCEDPTSIRTASHEQRTIQDENKSELHSSLGLDINPKVEDDKMECQTALGLVNGNAKVHT